MGLVSKLVWREYFRRKNVSSHWALLESTRLSDPEKRGALICDRIADALRYFGRREDSLPEWTYAADQIDTENVWQVWQSLPILSKQDVQQKFDPEYINNRFGIHGVIGATGGSTGEPTRFVTDSVALEAKTAAQLYVRTKFGWRPGDVSVAVWGSNRDIGLSNNWKGRLRHYLTDTRLISSYAFSDTVVDQVVALFQKYKRLELYGYASLLEQLAAVVLERGASIPKDRLVSAWSGGEPLGADQVELFRRAFDQTLHNHYGGREFGPIAYRVGGSNRFTIMRPNLFVEVVDDYDRPCAPGEIGRVLVTSLTGRGTPFLRYENGDLASFAPDDHDESGVGYLREIHGRISGITHLANGRRLHNIFWNQLFKEYPQVEQFQVQQSNTGYLTILLKGQGLSEAIENELCHRIATLVGPQEFTTLWTDEIPLTREGKRMQVVSSFQSVK